MASETKTVASIMDETGASGAWTYSDGNGGAGWCWEWKSDLEESDWLDEEVEPMADEYAAEVSASCGHELALATRWIVIGEGGNPHRVRLYL